MEKSEALDRLKVRWRGSPDSPLVIVAEAPGKGIPFHESPEGALLDRALAKAKAAPAAACVLALGAEAQLAEAIRIVEPALVLLLGRRAGELFGVQLARRRLMSPRGIRCPAQFSFDVSMACVLKGGMEEGLVGDIQQAWKLALSRAA